MYLNAFCTFLQYLRYEVYLNNIYNLTYIRASDDFNPKLMYC